jgi:PhzF family phenazine biosynthesis protein
MQKTIYQVDAFTDRAFKGNPAGVMIIDEHLSDEWMQNMAAEMNLSETAFLLPVDNHYQIRYFTPTREEPLCGHATLASAHIIYELRLKKSNEPILFKAKGGELTIKKESDFIVMNFPEYPLKKIETPPLFRKIVGFEPAETYASSYEWIVAVARNEEEIIKASPQFEKMTPNGLGNIMITAKSKKPAYDFVVRCFAPVSGINEDPVTGSAHCALAPLWAKKLHKTEMISKQVSKRSGELIVKLLDKRVEIKGKAITIFEADIKI